MTNDGIEIERVKVLDPYEPDKLLTVERNTRTDPIEHMWSRKLLDQPQYQAANKFMSLWERAAFGGAKAIDYREEKVDVSGFRSAVPMAAIDAQSSLRDARRELGRESYSVIVAVAGERHTIEDVAKGFYRGSRSDQEFISRLLKIALSELADHWGYSSTAPIRRKTRSWATDDGKPREFGIEDDS